MPELSNTKPLRGDLNKLMYEVNMFISELNEDGTSTTPTRSHSLQEPQRQPSPISTNRSNTVISRSFAKRRQDIVTTDNSHHRLPNTLQHAYSSPSYNCYYATPPTPPSRSALRSLRSTSATLVEPGISSTTYFYTQTSQPHHQDYVNTYLTDTRKRQEKTAAYEDNEEDDTPSSIRSSSFVFLNEKHTSTSSINQHTYQSPTRPTVLTLPHKRSSCSSSSVPSPSSTPPVISFPSTCAYMSVLGKAFIKRVRSLEHVRELFCANEYPESFTGQEATKILQHLLDGIPEAYCVIVANTFMKATPPLFEPIHYSQKSIIQRTFFNSTDEYYTLQEDSDDVPTGLLTSLLECYTYDCLPGRGGCYAPRCPNKPEVFDFEFNVQDPSLAMTTTSKHRTSSSEHTAQSTLQMAWAQKVPQALLATLSKKEIARQEAMNELIYSEQVYQKDLQVLAEAIVIPLSEKSSIIPSPKKRKEFVHEVFGNYKQLLEVSAALFEDLVDLQQQYENACIPMIGDVLIKHYAYFEDPFTRYCPRVSLAEYLIKEEARNNPDLEKFIAHAEKSKRMRRLAFRHFLLNPVTRLQRYPLLLDAILKKTEPDHPDYTYLSKCLDMVKKVASQSDALADVFKKRVQILEINDMIRFKPGEYQDLKLTDPHRKLYYQGDIKRRSGGITEVTEKTDIHAFIFDHLMLLTKPRKSTTATSVDEYRVWKRPIPLQMLYVAPLATELSQAPTSSSLRSNSQASFLVTFTFQHLGQRGGTYSFMCMLTEKQKWLGAIEEAKTSLRKRTGEDVFEVVSLDDISFRYMTTGVGSKQAKVTCTALFTSVCEEKKLVIGTDTGVYIKSMIGTGVRRVISTEGVTQLSVLEKHHILLVLADKTLRAYPLDLLDSAVTTTSGKPPERLGQELGQHIHYFQVGFCNNRDLVVYKKKRNTSSIFTALEPLYDLRELKNQKYITHKTGFIMGNRSSHAWFKKYKEFYVGAESNNIHFLKSKLLIVCERGFEIIDPENLSVGGRDIPDKMDPQFNFVHRQADIVKPIAMYRIHDKFLLCYSKFAFYVNNRNGSLVQRGPQRLPLLCEWEGTPEHIVYQYPYIIAFDPQFIEVRHVDTGDLVQIIPGEQIRLTYYTSDITQDIGIHGCQTHAKRPDLQNIFYLKLQKTTARKYTQ